MTSWAKAFKGRKKYKNRETHPQPLPEGRGVVSIFAIFSSFMFINQSFFKKLLRPSIQGGVGGGPLLFHLRLGFSETTLAALEALDGLVQVGFGEVGPVGVAEIELGIGDLPEQIVRDAQLATRADEQVGVGHEARLQVLGDGFLGDVFGEESTRFQKFCRSKRVVNFCHDFPDGLGDFPAA